MAGVRQTVMHAQERLHGGGEADSYARAGTPFMAGVRQTVMHALKLRKVALSITICLTPPAHASGSQPTPWDLQHLFWHEGE